MGATIKDIAKLSGVGNATVSRVLNGTGSVSQETRVKVQAAAKELNYVPNINARNLKLNQSRTILMVVKTISNVFFHTIIEMTEKQLSLRGYNLDIRNVFYSEQEMEVAIREKQNRNICGIIILGGRFGYTEEDFKRLSVPCVLVTIKACDEVDQRLYSSVIIDDVAEGYRAVNYLIEMGHRRIGIIYNNSDADVTPNYKRLVGYKNALEKNGIPCDSGLISNVATAQAGYEFGFRMLRMLKDKNPDMTAVFTTSDTLAIGAAKGAYSIGMKIPEDLSIIGFDGIEETEYYQPAIDTVVQPAKL